MFWMCCANSTSDYDGIAPMASFRHDKMMYVDLSLNPG